MTAIDVSNPWPGIVSVPFWPAGQPRLRLSVEPRGDKLLVRGFDPDANRQVFEADLYPDQNEAFVKAVREAVTLVPINERPANDNVVVISGPGPQEPGPKRMYELDVPREGERPPAPLPPY